MGATDVYKIGAWSGEDRAIRPSELVDLMGIQWARERGYRYYDFDDISLAAARTILAGGELPSSASSLTRFKLRIGGTSGGIPQRIPPLPASYLEHPLPLGGAPLAPAPHRATSCQVVYERPPCHP